MMYPKNWGKTVCYDWYENEKKIWLCLGNKNAICEIDKKSEMVKVLGNFPHNSLGESKLSLSVVRCGDHVIFAPFKANDIAVLNISTDELEFIDLSCLLNRRNSLNIEEKFYRMMSYKNNIYFLGIKYPAIMRFNLSTKEIDLFDDWIEEVEEQKCKEAVLFTDGYAQKENIIYLPMGKCSGVLKINLDTMEWKYVNFDLHIQGILGMTQKENIVWFTEYDIKAKNFFQWNLKNGNIEEIILPYQDAFYAPLYCENALMFFQNYGKKNLRYNLVSEKWENIENTMPEIQGYGDKKMREGVIDYFSLHSGRFYHWNVKTRKLWYNEYRIKDEEFLKNSWRDSCVRCKREINKESNMNLKEYIEMTERVESDKSERNANSSRNVFWDYFKR